ncbi:MAG: type II secretion system protein [Desulfobacterales bacterium]|nr:type II secretion system protein [Desulfobacterales bacterium]
MLKYSAALRPREGFTLIETLVAVSILAISLVVIMQLFSGGLKSGKLSGDYTRGIFHAREKMEEVLLVEKLEEMAQEGDFDDDYRWEADVVKIEPEDEEDEKLPFDAYNIRVDVKWDMGGKEKHFEVSTMRLAEKRKD